MKVFERGGVSNALYCTRSKSHGVPVKGFF